MIVKLCRVAWTFKRNERKIFHKPSLESLHAAKKKRKEIFAGVVSLKFSL